jgi:hypothetical protein
MGVLHIATEAVMMKGIVRETRKTDAGIDWRSLADCCIVQRRDMIPGKCWMWHSDRRNQMDKQCAAAEAHTLFVSFHIPADLIVHMLPLKSRTAVVDWDRLRKQTVGNQTRKCGKPRTLLCLAS